MKNKITALFKIINLYTNWPTVVYNRFSPFKKPKVIYKLKNGLKIIVRTDSIAEGRIVDNTFLGEYSYPGFEIKNNDTVIDIGAHIGSFTLYASKTAKSGRVIVLEPSSKNFITLSENIKLNKLTNVKLENKAVLSKTGTINLYLNSLSSGLYSVFNKSEHFEKVKVTTITSIFSKYKIKRCNLLKIDAEGAEYEILTTIPVKILKRIDKIVFEYHDRNSKGKYLKKIISRLKKNGFKIVLISKNSVVFSSLLL